MVFLMPGQEADTTPRAAIRVCSGDNMTTWEGLSPPWGCTEGSQKPEESGRFP